METTLDKIIWKHYKRFRRKYKQELPASVKELIMACAEEYHRQMFLDIVEMEKYFDTTMFNLSGTHLADKERGKEYIIRFHEIDPLI